MLYTPLPTAEDDGFRTPVPTLKGFSDDPKPSAADTPTDAPTADPPTSRPTSTDSPAWSGTPADD